MDVLRLAIRSPVEDFNGDVLRIQINGIDLIDLVKSAELPFATAEGHPEIAGKYDGLPIVDVGSAGDHFLGRPQPVLEFGGRTCLLDCTCGVAGCWPLLATVAVGDQTVTWSDFGQPHRGPDSAAGEWEYGGFGPFRFDRAQYETELEGIDAQRVRGQRA